MKRRIPMSLSSSSRQGESPTQPRRILRAELGRVNWLIGADQKAFFAFFRDVERASAAEALGRTTANRCGDGAAIRWRNPVSRSVCWLGAQKLRARRHAGQPVDRATRSTSWAGALLYRRRRSRGAALLPGSPAHRPQTCAHARRHRRPRRSDRRGLDDPPYTWCTRKRS